MFDVVENDSPKNAAFALDETSGGSGGDRVNFADREVLISKEMLGQNECKIKHYAQSKVDDCSCIVGAGINGGGGVV